MEKDEVAKIMSADVAVTWRRKIDGVLMVVLIRRGGETEHGKLAFPGGREKEEDTQTVLAGRRELWEEGHLIVQVKDMRFLAFLDKPGRDPRGQRRASVVFTAHMSEEEALTARAGDDAAAVEHTEVLSIKREQMAFDHYDAIFELQDRERARLAQGPFSRLED